jgi:hypothetical protein
MLKKIGQRFKDVLSWLVGTRRLAELAVEQRNILAYSAYLALLQTPKYRDPRALAPHGFKVYSQAEEDGILHEIFRRIGIVHSTFIEIGVSHGRECNTRLLLRQGWKGLWIDGSMDYVAEIRRFFVKELATGQLTLVRDFVTQGNVNDLLTAHLVGNTEVDLFSIDIDGNDFHVLSAISAITPRVIVVEYNPIFAPPLEWIAAYDPSHQWQGDDDYSAALKSYELLLAPKGYALIGCTLNGSNAFFVRRDLLRDHFVLDTSAECHYEPQRFWLTNGSIGGHGVG